MIEIVPIGGCKYVAATPLCLGFSSVPSADAYTLRRVASSLSWEGPEDFALNVVRMDDEERCAEALSIPVAYAPLEGFIAQRDVFTQELVSAFPCIPAHQITVEQRSGMRAWDDAEAVKMKTKNPALSQWLERMRDRLDEPALPAEKVKATFSVRSIRYTPSPRQDCEPAIPHPTQEFRARSASPQFARPLGAAS